MGYITILPEELACQEDYLANHLPTRYMEDFTLLGFTVSVLSRAVDLLENAGYTVICWDGEYGDLANTIYQA